MILLRKKYTEEYESERYESALRKKYLISIDIQYVALSL